MLNKIVVDEFARLNLNLKSSLSMCNAVQMKNLKQVRQFYNYYLKPVWFNL